jgi:predicted nucleotidyltransferase
MTELSSNLADVIAACKTHDVARLELFGSRARTDFTSESDYDFLVEFREPLRDAFGRYFSLQESLEAILGAKVDLTGPQVRNAALRRRIDADKKLIYAA